MSQDGSRPRVFVVDDDREVVDCLIDVFSMAGYQVEGFLVPELALRAVELRPPDIVITDLEMPGMPGDVLTRHIKRVSPRTRCVIFTGAGIDPARLDCGADAWICKGVEVSQLLAEIVRALRPRRRL